MSRVPRDGGIDGRPGVDAAYTNLTSQNATVRGALTAHTLEADDILLNGVSLAELLEVNRTVEGLDYSPAYPSAYAPAHSSDLEDLRQEVARVARVARVAKMSAPPPAEPTLAVKNKAKKGYVLTASDENGNAEWRPLPAPVTTPPPVDVSAFVAGPSRGVEPGALAVFRNPRQIQAASGVSLEDDALKCQEVRALCLRVGRDLPRDGQVLKARDGKATWEDDAAEAIEDRLAGITEFTKDLYDQHKALKETHSQHKEETALAIREALAALEEKTVQLKDLNSRVTQRLGVVEETSRDVIQRVENVEDASAHQDKLAGDRVDREDIHQLQQSFSALADELDQRGDALKALELQVEKLAVQIISGDQGSLVIHNGEKAVTEARLRFHDLTGSLEAPSLDAKYAMISEELNAHAAIVSDLTAASITASSASVENLTASRFSARTMRLADNARRGRVMVCEDDEGTFAWKEADQSLTCYDEAVRRAIPVFTQDKDHAVSPSAAFVDEGGSLAVQSVHTRSEAALVRNGGTLVGTKHDGTTLMTGSQCTSFGCGEGALRSAERPENVVAVGQDAMGACELPQSSVAVGAFALSCHEAPSDIVAVGHAALMHSEKGRGNTGLGSQSLWANRTGDHNTGVGSYSLHSSMGSANTAVGSYSLSGAIGGDGNTAVGTGAGDAVVRGSGNTAVGDGAGPMEDFSRTVCIGKGARALQDGDVALGSEEAPVNTSTTASAGDLSVLNPAGYLPITLNGKRYKLALYHA